MEQLHIFNLHGLPRSIVSDTYKISLSNFWSELFTLQQVDLRMSTAYHPQSDGQTEVVNRCLEGYLRWMTGEKPPEWVLWLPLAGWCRMDSKYGRSATNRPRWKGFGVRRSAF